MRKQIFQNKITAYFTKILFLFCLSFILPDLAFGAVITSSQSGNWSDASSWTGGVVPNPVSDSAVIAAGHTLTLAESSIIPATTVEGGLVQTGGINTVLGGNLTMGNGTGKDGLLTLGAGSTFDMNGFNWIGNNYKLNTTATSGNWSKVLMSGTSSITMGDWSSWSKQDIVIPYVSFVATGTANDINWSGREDKGGAGLTNRIYANPAVFDGLRNITVGIGGHNNDGATDRVFDGSDFRNISGIITLKSGNIYTTGERSAKNIIFTGSSAGNAEIKISDVAGNWDFSNSVFWNAGTAQSHAHGGHNFSGCFFGADIPLYQGNQIYTKGDIFDGSYVFRTTGYYNAHPFSIQGLTSPYTLQNMIFEVWGDEPNLITLTSVTQDVTIKKILSIAHGDTVNSVGNISGTNLRITQNTRYIPSYIDNIAATWLTENGVYTGNLHMDSNITAAKISNGYGARVSGNYVQEIDYWDYNNYHNLSGKYLPEKFTFPNGGSTHDVEADPDFVDASRKLSLWGIGKGADGSEMGSVGYILGRSGYDPVSHTQKNANAYALDISSDLYAWVHQGFVAQSPALKAAGEGGVDIGAVEVVIDPVPKTKASPVSGSFNEPVNVSLLCSDDVGCTATYYCIGESCTPDALYAGPVAISSSSKIRFRSTDGTNTETVKEAQYTIGRVDNFPNLRTGGFDYTYSTDPEVIAWLASHHDVVVGYQHYTTSLMHEDVYDQFKAVNPDIKLMRYVPYNTMLTKITDWMEEWCVDNGRDPEQLYYHYYYDTTVYTFGEGNKMFKGYGGGSATNLAEARVPSAWYGGDYPTVNPTSQVFRDAYNAYVLYLSTVAPGKFGDGLFLDSHSGLIDSYHEIHLENIIELRNLGKTTPTLARAQVVADIAAHTGEMKNYLREHTGKYQQVIPNAAEMDFVWESQADLYTDLFDPAGPYNEAGIEYLTNPGRTSIYRIPYLKKAYDDLEKGVLGFFNSETAYTENVPHAFAQNMLANFYLINHPNATFSYHLGGASYYGATGTPLFSQSHWHKNMEYDVGVPVVRNSADFWGQNDTDRFFAFASGVDSAGNYTVLGREYSNALVLAKFSTVTGWANIGVGPSTHQLGGTYRLLQADNTLGPQISEITLASGQGAILIKDFSTSDIIAPSAPSELNVQ